VARLAYQSAVLAVIPFTAGHDPPEVTWPLPEPLLGALLWDSPLPELPLDELPDERCWVEPLADDEPWAALPPRVDPLLDALALDPLVTVTELAWAVPAGSS
jgi:hypothetical protein